MKKSFLLILFASLAIAAQAMAPKPATPARMTSSFDAGWRFAKGEATGAEQAAFADGGWRLLDVPHDWSIEGPFDAKAATRGAGAFLPSGVAWYRKHFVLPAGAASKRVFIEFDGVMQNSDVWINGHKLGHRPFGYVSFRYELTDQVQFGDGSDNVIAVRTDTSAQPASRWYSGAGIYRHVRLIITDPVHLEQWATFISTKNIVIGLGQPVNHHAADLSVQTRVINQSPATRDVALRITLIDPVGKIAATADLAAQSVPPGQSAAFQHDFKLADPWFWFATSPQLYHAHVAVRTGETTTDDESVSFGIRSADFDSETGFRLNGVHLKLYGVCLHHDGGAFGAAVPLSVWEYRLNALRQIGVNAIRTAHNPPDPGFLDLCDRLGFLVMDELFDCWEVGKNPHDYHLFFDEWSKTDVRDTVRRDRNHPSVVLWSSGNEIHDTPKEEKAKAILAGLVAAFHENDPTRPVTQALFRPNVSHDYTNGLADLLDVIGTNYRDAELLAAWRAKPGRKIVGTEQRQDRETWLLARNNPQHSGQFLWSGIDYLGEALRWPTVAAGSGLLDKTGAIKPMGLERQSWWSPQPVVSLARRTAPSQFAPGDPGFVPLNRRQVQFADWSPANREPHNENVEVYSNCESVELFLNGKSLGAQPLNADASPRAWTVPFDPGTLRAVAKNQGAIVATSELRTAGAPARVVLSASRTSLAPTFEDVVAVTALIVDANGVVVPAADSLVSFSITGPGTIAATDNADNASHESFQAPERQAFRGRCVAFVRATATSGNLLLTASAPGLAPGKISFAAVAPR